MLEKKPKIHPVVHRADRDSIHQFLTKFFEPMLIIQGEEKELVQTFGKHGSHDDVLSASHDDDLSPSLRAHLDCARCGNPAEYICRNCENISYCSIWCQQIDWLRHKQRCHKEKKD